MIGQYDAAVIDKENGKPHVVKRMGVRCPGVRGCAQTADEGGPWRVRVSRWAGR
jgi:hypothetical protein